ncbi:NAD(P)H dehydrogenase [quinone] 1 isoform X3 [Syngnathoides biaculeatus]|uniref:NAD(P)H dehydrogenase [quinone] 1 isoform X3 n=1 Tax=Syngnathoides biaculeatus TaxID=300417 RepID=UPI002ADE9400|nr:NAD(P)H dehydrogenase [quinone] 1 isoform X3 [Syngnathoides biaculeatus]
MEAAPKEENSGDEQHQVAEDSQLFETEDVESQKTVLIVYAHQSMGSFNEALRDIAAKELSMQGYRIIVSDLYAMNFKANSTQDDIIGDLKNPELFQYGEETMHAWKEGRLSEDIVAEQRKVEEAELIIFQFPLYWFSVPAIMKGWMDRVLTQGFAFSLEKMYNNGIFKNKKAMLSFTTGATESMFRPDGINGDINVALWPLQSLNPIPPPHPPPPRMALCTSVDSRSLLLRFSGVRLIALLQFELQCSKSGVCGSKDCWLRSL